MIVRLVGIVVLCGLVVGFGPPPPPAPLQGGVAPAVRTVVDGLPVVGELAGDILSEISTEQPFSLVGVSLPQGSTVLMRTALEGGPWSSWIPMEPIGEDGDGPDASSGEAVAAQPGWEQMSEPVWTGEASKLQLLVSDGEPRDVTVHLIDTLGVGGFVDRLGETTAGLWGRPEPPIVPPAAPAVVPPAVVTRAQWGADEARRSGPPSYSTPRAGILHHTATSNDYTREQAPAVVRAIYAYHTGSLGWSDIGYNLLIDRFGTVYEGRAGGLDRGVIGAHAGGFNTETFGVSVMGTFTSGLPPEAALAAITDIVAWKFALHGINPDPNSTVVIASRGSTRYPDGHHARMHTLSGHRHVSTTACPGDALFAHLPALRHRVFAHAS